MMEEPLSQGASPSGDNFSGSGDLSSATIVTLDERLLDITARHTLNVLRTPPTKKAKRVRFFRNGDKFYTGVVMAVTPERYRSFDSLASDLTRALVSSVTLPNGVRAIYTMDGRKVQSVSDLEDGKCYVVSGQGEIFKKVEYSSSKVRRGSSLSGLPQSPAGTGRQISAIPLCVKARIVTLIRHGTKPRKVVRLLLNKRNAPSLEHALEAITEAVKLDSGAVRKVYTLSGQQVSSLEQFFENDEIFLAYGPEKANQDDFELDFEESKSVQSFRRCPWISKRQSGPMPRMPRKSGKKALTTPQVRTPSPSAVVLPQPLRLHYAVGHIIGDGNFAVVRHCVHKSTGTEYAIKIVDKYKCQRNEIMLASEVAILRQVCHPNIISLIAVQETADQRFLVMELVKGGDLFDAIAAATKFSEAEASVMIGHLTSALAYLHSHHIVHRDVKPENLLVEMDGSHVRCLKLGDFGLAQVVREPLYTVCGTPTYVAPEILAESGYGLKIDVWAAGVILYILLCGFPPFVSPENEQEELFERILSGQYEFTSPYWDAISDSAKQLISNMLQAQPELRFSAEDVLDHPWLAQSFLGGEQTAATTSSNAAEQHWDQQRKPIRLATFEFDYKKQRMHGGSEEVTADLDNIKTSIRNRWNDAPSTENANFIRRAEESQNSTVAERDEIDFANGNQSEEEPVSLSADCLQDIHTLSQSMHNLINDLNETQERRQCCRSSRSTASSRDSILGNDSLQTQKDNYNAGSPIRQRGSWGHASTETSPSMNRTNGNSFPGNYDDSPTTPRASDIQMNRNLETPKTCRSNMNKQRCRRKQCSEISSASDNIASSFDSNDVSCCETSCRSTISSSSDSLTGSFSNDIETSDSFVNIQFAQLASGQKSSSTQSMESTDSFENIRFSNQVMRDDCTTDSNKNDCSETVVQRSYRSEDTVCTNEEKSDNKVSRTRMAPGVDTSKVPRSLNIITSNAKRISIHSVRKSQEVGRSSTKSETVKLRDDKCFSARNSVDAKNATKSKRFSCFSAYSDKKVLDAAADKSVYAAIKNGRKFSSTDELRDEKQKQSVKSKRFSLYYTPQPLRKTYEAEIKAGKNTCKNSTASGNERQNAAKVTDANKRKDEMSGCDDKRNIRNRKSVIDGSTAASRSKANKQNVHNKNNVVNTNLNSGRTK